MEIDREGIQNSKDCFHGSNSRILVWIDPQPYIIFTGKSRLSICYWHLYISLICSHSFASAKCLLWCKGAIHQPPHQRSEPTTEPQDLTAVSATRQTLDVVVDFGHIPLWPSHWNTARCVFYRLNMMVLFLLLVFVCLSSRWLKDAWGLGRKLYAWYTLYISILWTYTYTKYYEAMYMAISV